MKRKKRVLSALPALGLMPMETLEADPGGSVGAHIQNDITGGQTWTESGKLSEVLLGSKEGIQVYADAIQYAMSNRESDSFGNVMKEK